MMRSPLVLAPAVALVILTGCSSGASTVGDPPPPTYPPSPAGPARPVPRTPGALGSTARPVGSTYTPSGPGQLGYTPQTATVVPPVDVPPVAYTPPAEGGGQPAPGPAPKPAPGTTSRNAFIAGVFVASTVGAVYNVDDNGVRFAVTGTSAGMTPGVPYVSALHSDRLCVGAVVGSLGPWQGQGTSRTISARFPGVTVEQVGSIDIASRGVLVNCAPVQAGP